MHPLKTYLDSLKTRTPNKQEYWRQVGDLARKVGVKQSMFHRIHNPNQNGKLGIVPALRMEIETNGAVPAVSVNDSSEDVVDLALKVFGARVRRGEPQ